MHLQDGTGGDFFWVYEVRRLGLVSADNVDGTIKCGIMHDLLVCLAFQAAFASL